MKRKISNMSENFAPLKICRPGFPKSVTVDPSDWGRVFFYFLFYALTSNDTSSLKSIPFGEDKGKCGNVPHTHIRRGAQSRFTQRVEMAARSGARVTPSQREFPLAAFVSRPKTPAPTVMCYEPFLSPFPDRRWSPQCRC